MRTRLALLVLVLLGLGLLPGAASAQGNADGGGANNAAPFRTQAAEVRAQWVDENGIETSYWVYGADDASPERISKVLVAFSVVDTTATDCGYDPGPKATAEPGGCPLVIAECYAELDEGAFGVTNHRLDGAWLDMTLTCYDPVAQGVLAVAVSVSWTAVGEQTPFRVNELYHLHGGPYTFTRHVHATSRAAAAAGSIAWEGGEIAVGPEAEAWIADAMEIVTD